MEIAFFFRCSGVILLLGFSGFGLVRSAGMNITFMLSQSIFCRRLRRFIIFRTDALSFVLTDYSLAQTFFGTENKKGSPRH